MRKIADRLDRSPSTISRELERNGLPTKVWSGGYAPERAQQLAERRRRWDGRFKLMRQPKLQARVLKQLQRGWSPEQIAGRLADDRGHDVISHEAIYRFIYHRSAQKDYWHRLLPKAKSRRGRLARGGGSPVDRIRDRLGMATYFCDPHAPWQKGGIENAIGRMRRRLPRKTDLATLSHAQLRQLIANYNRTPRKCLGFKTPSEVFNQSL